MAGVNQHPQRPRLVIPLFAAVIALTGCKSTMQSNPDPNPGGPDAPPGMEIIAHRGFSHVAPENTVAAYRKAWEAGADGAETDVYLTRDNQVVAIHDKTTKRTCGADLDVKSSTYDALRELDAGILKDPKFAGERIPRLQEILASLPPGKPLYVEIKCGTEILPALESALDESGKRAQVVLIGFELTTVAEAKKRMPDRPVLWLRGTREDKKTKEKFPHDLAWVGQAHDRGLDGLDVDYAGMTREFADAVHSAGLKLTVWTVNDPEIAAKMRDLGADGLTTDRPDLMRDLR